MVKSALPGRRVPVVDQDGYMTDPWYNYEQAEHSRTGGNATDAIADATAEALFNATVGVTSAGALATIFLQVRTTIAEAFHAASIKLSSLAGGLSRVEITADTISIDGTLLNNGALLTPFAASNAWTLAGNTTDASATAAAAASAWTPLTSRTVTFTGKPVEVDATCDIKANNSNHLYGFAITIDSTNPEDGNALYNSNPAAGPVFDIGASGTQRSWSRHLDVTPSAASHTLRIYGMSDSTAIDFLNKGLRTAEIKA